MDIVRKKNKTRRRVWKTLLCLAVLVVLVFVTIGLARLKPAAPSLDRSTVLIETVKRGSMLRQVRGIGTLIPEQVRVIPAPAEGRIERILVQPGVEVTADTVLVELVNPQLAQETVDARYKVEAAEADLANLRVQLESDRMSQEAAAATVQADYNQAKLQLDTDEALAKDGLIPVLNLRISRVKVEELANRLRIEKERLANKSQAAKAQLASQQARIEQLRALAQLKASQVASLAVRAGTSGVVQQISVEVGQQVTPGGNIARIADPQSLKAELKIAETQAKDIQIGQSVSIDTRNGLAGGHVSRIDPAVQEGTVKIDVALDDALPKGARPDLSVDGTIELERLENILYVGRPAFGQERNTITLFKLDGEGASAVRTQVRLGRSSVNTIEILDGLSEGDRVILSDTSAWDNQDRVRLK
jgi:HlyD family secretion protein